MSESELHYLVVGLIALVYGLDVRGLVYGLADVAGFHAFNRLLS